MGTPEVATQVASGEELYGMGDVGRCELVEGRIVPMSPAKPQHGEFEHRMARLIDDFVPEADAGVLLVEPEAQVVSLCRSPTDFIELGTSDMLSLDDGLPGFALSLAELFRAGSDAALS